MDELREPIHKAGWTGEQGAAHVRSKMARTFSVSGAESFRNLYPRRRGKNE